MHICNIKCALDNVKKDARISVEIICIFIFFHLVEKTESDK